MEIYRPTIDDLKISVQLNIFYDSKIFKKGYLFAYLSDENGSLDGKMTLSFELFKFDDPERDLSFLFWKNTDDIMISSIHPRITQSFVDALNNNVSREFHALKVVNKYYTVIAYNNHFMN